MFSGLNEFYNPVRMLLASRSRRINFSGAVSATEISMRESAEWNEAIDPWQILRVFLCQDFQDQKSQGLGMLMHTRAS